MKGTPEITRRAVDSAICTGNNTGRVDWLDFALVNISPITDSENKNICAHKGINHPIVTNTIPVQPGKLAFEHGVCLRFFCKLLFYFVKYSAGLSF